MPIKELLFGFNGRIRRTHYWLGSLGAGAVLGVIIVILAMIFGGAIVMMAGGGGNGGGAGAIIMGIVGMLIFLGLIVVTMWISFALQIKRWHDRDKPAVYVLINFIPFVGAVWTFVECGFLDGTQGPNRYGPSPKGIAGPAPQPAAVA